MSTASPCTSLRIRVLTRSLFEIRFKSNGVKRIVVGEALGDIFV
jgi:hypothetical protein